MGAEKIWALRRTIFWNKHFVPKMTIYSFSSLQSMTQNVFKENTKKQLKSQTRNSKDSRQSLMN